MDPYKALLLRSQINVINETLTRLQLELKELEEALKWVQTLHPKSAYKIFGGKVAIEIDPKEIRKIIEDEIRLLKAKIDALEKEKDKLLSELNSSR